ncbi:MAG: ABC transporter permease subunit [Deferribacteres bacterium]|nr:ABC transporter permease subunit [candidate division KSB1 bacterium]MCB9502718.1 ABC transporter permease subunit [Deferribacteres bacterium]
MFKILLEKELKAFLNSPKFVATFIVCTLLILLSVFIGIQEYKSGVRQYETARKLVNDEMQSASSWRGLSTRIYRKPDPMHIFVSGLHYDLGRVSAIDNDSGVKLTNSIYSDDPIFAVFRFIDFTFIVQVVLSLFAILFTYDAINGERESGTLKLTFANAVPKVKYIIAKSLGSWLGLVIPLLLPLLLAILLLLLLQIPMTGHHWARLLSLFGVSFLYFTFFIFLGVLVSSLTRQSSISFLTLLVLWIVLVFIVPRAGIMLAAHIEPVPSVAEIDGKLEAFSKDQWEQHLDAMESRWQERNRGTENMTKEEREAWKDDNSWQWMQEDEKEREKTEKAIDTYATKLRQDLRNRQRNQEKLAFVLARFSPVSSYKLTAMHLAETDIELKSEHEDALQQYRDQFLAYRDNKAKQNADNAGGIRIEVDNEGLRIQGSADQGTLDIADAPVFHYPQRSFGHVIAASVMDVGWLFFWTVVVLAWAFVGFLRYDVR